MTKLTRNESADKIRNIWASVVELSPASTNRLRVIGSMTYIVEVADYNVADLHRDHYQWLVNALNNDLVLETIDTLANFARAAGGEVAVPWRD